MNAYSAASPEEMAAADRAALANTARRGGPPRLDPMSWAPPIVMAKSSRRKLDPEYDAYRNANRVFRRAFGRGERWRKSLLACGAAKLKGKS
jgi:hypothetical protein